MAELTDNEIMELDDDAFEEAQIMSDEIAEHEPEIESEPIVETQEPEVTSSEVEVEEEEEHEDSASEETEEPIEEEEVAETETEEFADTEPETEVEEEESPESTEEESFNYETSYNEIMKPLKVSGKEVQVKSIDDLRNLANMGIDYSRKMRDVKPLRALGETLTKAGIIVDGIVNEEAITRLIDIDSGNPAAIAQLLKEKGIDPLDVETENINYVPETSMVSESTIALQDVERQLVESGGLDSVVDAVSKLDSKSKQFFNESPENLLKLQADIASGSYDMIMGTIEYEKSLGRLNGLSDMEAYVQIARSQAAPVVETPATVVTPQAVPSKDKRKAAGISKRAPAKTQKQTYDYINMSDEEFEKLTPDTQSVY